jgi:outer membrane protein OmpA-like peptidoglycan-associated protein
MLSGKRWYERFRGSLVRGGVCLMLLASCAAPGPPPSPAPKQSVFLLIPDPEGKVGQITVTNRTGTQVVDQHHHASTVRSADHAPSPPSTLEETEIQRIFGHALAAQPAGPARFILYFKDDSEELTPDSEVFLPEVFRTIRDRGAMDISIIGHTDTMGARDFNYQLSLRRARKVADLLVLQGMDRNILDIESHGEDNLLVKTRDQVREPRNRRVEITVW